MLHDMPVALVPGTAGLVAISSPPDSVAIRRFSSRPHHRFNMADVDCIRAFGRIQYPTGRRRLVCHQPSPPSCRWSRPWDCRSRPQFRRRLVPSELCRHRRRFSSAYHLFEAFNMHHFGCYVG